MRRMRPNPTRFTASLAAFADGPANLACVQGVLDFYNPGVNWLSRCFTIEYATWFRIILPGMQRLGLAVPLGGTTLFFPPRRSGKLGGWDAYNVTEDADLGIRLARHGYVTHLLPTVTYEEANCHILPWIKQRSRWLKGYAITWMVHMRQPASAVAAAWAWRFFGVQVLFLGTLVQFLLAPLLWSFWLMLLGFGPPVARQSAGSGFCGAGGDVPDRRGCTTIGWARCSLAGAPSCGAMALAAGAACLFSAGGAGGLQSPLGTCRGPVLLGQDGAWKICRRARRQSCRFRIARAPIRPGLVDRGFLLC